MTDSCDKPYKLIDHTADIAIAIQGRDLAELFANAAFGLFDSITDISAIKAESGLEIKVVAESLEELMVNWLGELLYRFEVGSMLFAKFDVTGIDEAHLIAKVYGEQYEPDRHEILNDIKAITYHQLEVRKTNSRWETAVVFDI